MMSMHILLMMVEFPLDSVCVLTMSNHYTLIVSVALLQLTSATAEQNAEHEANNGCSCSLSRQARWRQWLFPMATKAVRLVNKPETRKLEELGSILSPKQELS